MHAGCNTSFASSVSQTSSLLLVCAHRDKPATRYACECVLFLDELWRGVSHFHCNNMCVPRTFSPGQVLRGPTLPLHIWDMQSSERRHSCHTLSTPWELSAARYRSTVVRQSDVGEAPEMVTAVLKSNMLPKSATVSLRKQEMPQKQLFLHIRYMPIDILYPNHFIGPNLLIKQRPNLRFCTVDRPLVKRAGVWRFAIS